MIPITIQTIKIPPIITHSVTKNDDLESASSVIGAVVTLTLVVVWTSAAWSLVVFSASITDIRMLNGLEGADVGVFDVKIDGICEGEDGGRVDGKFDGDIEGEMDGIDDTPVGELDGVAVVGGNVSAPYPLNKKPVNIKPFTYC